MQKKIPGFVYDMPINLLKNLISGYIESDGHCSKNNKNWVNITSINYELLYSIAHCIEKVYKTPCRIRQINNEHYKEIEGRLVHCAKAYVLTFAKQLPSSSRCFYEDDYLWYPVKRVVKEKIEKVYDIQVNKAHSFVANHCINHNCQAFSIAGKQQGFKDSYKGICRGTLFLDVARICEYHKPKVIFCENVKGLVSHDKGRTFSVIKDTFEEIGYKVFYKILNSKDFGVPQNRERIYIVAFRNDIAPDNFVFPEGFGPYKTIKDILDPVSITNEFYISEKYLNSLKRHKENNKLKGNGYGYITHSFDDIFQTIVCGGMGRERNLIIDERKGFISPNSENIRMATPREFFRAQGFPDNFVLPYKKTVLYKQVGNTVTVPIIRAIAEDIKKYL